MTDEKETYVTGMENHLFAAAIQSALDAGKSILDIYQSDDFAVELKADSTPLTRADRASHDLIVSSLEKTGYPFLSEEGKEIGSDVRQKWETFWLVDPLDGTKEFINRNGEFTVNIALIKSGVPVAGIVYAPVPDVLYFARQDAGAFKLSNASRNFGKTNGKKIQAAVPEDNTLQVVASRSHFNDETKDFIQSLEQKGFNVQIVNSGSSLKLCHVADGSAHIYPRFGPTMEWDTAAAHAVCREAGAVVLDVVRAREMVYNKKHLQNNYFLVYPKAMEDIVR